MSEHFKLIEKINCDFYFATCLIISLSDSKFVCPLVLQIFVLPLISLIIVHNSSIQLTCFQYLITETYHSISSIGYIISARIESHVYMYKLMISSTWLLVLKYYMYLEEQHIFIFMGESSGAGCQDPYPLEFFFNVHSK